MKRFKDTMVGKGSDLAKALEVGKKEAEKVYEATSERYKKQVSNEEDRKWFLNMSFPTKD